MHLLILPYLDCSDSHAYTISLELCAGFNDSTHKTSLLHFESVILYAPLHKDKLRTTAGDRGGAGLFSKIYEFLAKFRSFAPSIPDGRGSSTDFGLFRFSAAVRQHP